MEGGAKGRSRRTFTTEYKLEILRRAEALKGEARGRLAAYLTGEGLRASHVARWRKQSAAGVIGQGKRGRREKSRQRLLREIRLLRHRVAAMEKRALRAEGFVLLQMKYVRAAALRLGRKDRGLLSELIARMDQEAPVSSVCRALALTRRDFYRTILPLVAARKAG